MIDLKNLTEKQKKELLKELEAEKTKEEELKKERRESYKKLVSDVSAETFEKLKKISRDMSLVKKDIFESFKAVVDLKEELYGIKENQQSHTFTDTATGTTITIGRRVVDNYDDTVHAGIAKVKKYIATLTDGQGTDIEKVLELLLRKDKNGNLKASRVLELDKLAKDIENEDLKDGVRIIKDAYTPQKTAYFIEASYKDETGAKRTLPLSLSSVTLGEEYEENI